jgi:hypothetical protein
LSGTNTIGTNDPDADGFINNLEYYFDGNPTEGSPALLTAVASGSQVVLSFIGSTNTNAVNPGAISYVVQSSANLSGAWTNNTNATLAISVSTNQNGVLLSNQYERKQFLTPASDSGTKYFYRIQATSAQ